MQQEDGENYVMNSALQKPFRFNLSEYLKNKCLRPIRTFQCGSAVSVV